MSQRDVRLSKQFALLSHTPRIRSYLVLAANAQHSVLRETAAAFAQVPFSGAILTKVDETTRMGAALSVVHEKTCRWPISATVSVCLKICRSLRGLTP
jgi:flagellar biosynthesis protein FlhF